MNRGAARVAHRDIKPENMSPEAAALAKSMAEAAQPLNDALAARAPTAKQLEASRRERLTNAERARELEEPFGPGERVESLERPGDTYRLHLVPRAQLKAEWKAWEARR